MLERRDRNGDFVPVSAELVSPSAHDFEVLNGTTTTISYQFATDGHILTVGSGGLNVAVEVIGRAGACTPLGSDCAPGNWCPPSELTGRAVACIEAGAQAVGEPCEAPSDCTANSSCFDFGSGGRCHALCDSPTFGQNCGGDFVCQPQGSDYGVCAPLGAVESVCPLTQKLLPTTLAMDAVFDGLRCRVYVSTQSGEVVSHALRTGASSFLHQTGSALRGLDLSPSGEQLLVADTSIVDVEGSASNRVHLIDLSRSAARELTFPLAFFEAGTYMPLFIDEDTALVSSSFSGSGWVPLRRFQLADAATTVIADVRQDTMLARSADGRTVAYAESNISSGEFGRISVDDGSIGEGWANGYLSTIAVNRDGTQFAVPVYDGLYIYSSSGPASGFLHVRTLGAYASKYAAGVAYSPNSDVLYVAWRGYAPSIEAIDATTFDVLYQLDAGIDLGYGGAFGPGRMRISDDGRLLLVILPQGVMTYPVQFG